MSKDYKTIKDGQASILKMTSEGTSLVPVVILSDKIKTMKQWENTSTPSGFSEFAREGDQVDDEIFNYFWGVLPPMAYKKGIFQVSEPYSQRGGYFTYSTFQEIEKKFYFLGYLTKPEVLEIIKKGN